MKLRNLFELFNIKPQDVDLYHWDFDIECPTMSEVSMKDFTDSGLSEFEIVLNAEVVAIQSISEDQMSVWVRGVKRACVEDMTWAHAGYCSTSDYKKWFTEGSLK